MAKLTEGMILARCRGAELDTIRKLNCWGSELTDISIVKKLPALEILSLSVNNISSLADLQNCRMLQELYIRKNNIRDLSEICYLKDLRKLKCLWLADNPCAEHEAYRMTVLKHLPQLQKLDNVDVEPDEAREAHERGLDLIHPSDRHSVGGTGYPAYVQQQAYQPANTVAPAATSKPAALGSNASLSSRASSSSGSCLVVDQPIVEDQELVLQPGTGGGGGANSGSPMVGRRARDQLGKMESGSRDSLASEKFEPPPHAVESYDYEEAVPPMQMRRVPASAPPSRKVSQADGGGDGLASYGVRRHSQIDHAHGHAQVHHPAASPYVAGVRRPSDVEQGRHEYGTPYEVEFSPEYHQLQQQRQQQQMEDQMRRQEELRRQAGQQYAEAQYQAAEQIESFRNVNASPTRSTYSANSRPKHRTSNILSAVLCLLKELDVRSLEVVEMSARGRIEELLED